KRASAGDGTQHREIVLLTDIGNMERAMLVHPAILWPINRHLDASDGNWTKVSARNQFGPLPEPQDHVINPANFRRALDNSIEDWLHIRRRTADDAEDLGGCGLILQCLA